MATGEQPFDQNRIEAYLVGNGIAALAGAGLPPGAVQKRVGESARSLRDLAVRPQVASKPPWVAAAHHHGADITALTVGALPCAPAILG